MKYYGTLGPACADIAVLKRMFQSGMTGLRLNTSHGRLKDRKDWLVMADQAAHASGFTSLELLIDMVGPELRIGHLSRPIWMAKGQQILFGSTGSVFQNDCVLVPQALFDAVREGDHLLMDDGKMKFLVKRINKERQSLTVTVESGGLLEGDKSVAIEGVEVPVPAITQSDADNIADAAKLGIQLSAVMQPFVRSRQDLLAVREMLDAHGFTKTQIMAKIENQSGVDALPELIPACDLIIIARGDLGTAVTLPRLPVVQKQIEAVCHQYQKPYMVVTQMLDSMMHASVPTRAEVSDIAHAVFCGADALMLTGETAVGEYPVEAMQYLVATAENAQISINS